MHITDYKDGIAIKVNGIKLPEYTLEEQLLLRISMYCFWNEDYKNYTLKEAIEQFKKERDIEPEIVKILNFDKVAAISERLKDDRMYVIYAPCCYHKTYYSNIPNIKDYIDSVYPKKEV